VYLAGVHARAYEFCHRIGGCAYVEWAPLDAPAMLGQIGYQASVLLHSFDHRLPGPASHFPAVEEDDSGRPDRTGFPHKEIHKAIVCSREGYAGSVERCRDGTLSAGCQVAKCAWLTWAATRKALAATVKPGFNPALDGKNEASTT
jgi:hypothetical protein